MVKNKIQEPSPKVTETDSASGDDSVLASTMTDFAKARKYIQQHYQGVWDKCFKAYNGIRTKRGYAGVADDFVPETFAIVESLKSAVAGSKPKFKYLPLDEEQEQDTTTVNALVDYYWSRNNMTEKTLNWVGDMVVYGNGVLMVSWEGDYPLIQHIPISDFFVDPAATHMNRPEEPGYPRYAGYRYLTSIEELKSERHVNPETGELEDMYRNLDEISGSGDADDMDKDRKEQFIGSTFGKDAIKEQVEVIVYYTRKKKVMIANRGTVIYSGDNPYQRAPSTKMEQVPFNGKMISVKRQIPGIHGFLPFAILRNYVDSNLFFARGDVENILPTQEALNDTASQKRDNTAYALNNMWQIDPRFKHLAEQIESAPGNVFPIPKGALSPIEKQDVSPAADGEIARLTQSMRETTAATAAVQGNQQQYSRTTATEIQSQINQANMRFSTKIQNLEDEGFSQLARILFKMIQIFVTTEKAVRIVGKQGVEFKTFNPERFTGEYEPKVLLQSSVDSQNQMLTQAMQVAAQFSINNPIVNQKLFLQKMYETLFSDFMSDDDIQALLTVPQPIMGPDGQPVNPALVQAGAAMTPGAAAMMNDPNAAQSSRGNNFQKQTQTGQQGGGGADSSNMNLNRTKQDHPSGKLSAKVNP